MNEFIIKSCHELVDSVYADGREFCNECGRSVEDKKCQEVADCYLKEIAENLLKVVNSGLCGNCDGCGYDSGCSDDKCGVYVAHKCLDLLSIEFIDHEE